MRRSLGLGLAVAAAAVALFVWTRGDDRAGAPAGDPAAGPRSGAATGDTPPDDRLSPDRATPPRVMPRQRPLPRGESDQAAPPASSSARPSAAPSDPDRDREELTLQVENAKMLFADNDFERAAALAQQQLDLYPDSFWLRSIAVKSLCAMGDSERAKELIAEEPRTSQRKRLRIHCELQGGNPY